MITLQPHLKFSMFWTCCPIFLYVSSTKFILWVFHFFCYYVIFNFEVLEGKDLEACKLKITNFNFIINQLHVIPYAKSWFFVALCCIMILLLVIPIHKGDSIIGNWAVQWLLGRRSCVLCVDCQEWWLLSYVRDEIVSYWKQHWQHADHIWRKNWIRTKICLNSKAKYFIFGKVIVGLQHVYAALNIIILMRSIGIIQVMLFSWIQKA